MNLRSVAFLDDVCKLPKSDDAQYPIEASEIRRSDIDRDQFSVELSIGVEKILRGLFDARNVPDDLLQAYNLSFPKSGLTLYEHYKEMLQRPEESMTGFLSNIKGKVAELKTLTILEDHFPETNFALKPNPTEPVVDIVGTGPSGSEDVLVQVKIGQMGYVPEVTGRMEEHPNVLFVLGRELHEKISERRPDLVNILDLDISSSDLTQEISRYLNILNDNKGFDVPDSLGSILDSAPEFVLGIKSIINFVQIERDHRELKFDERSRIHALTALSLMSKFGIASVCISLGGALGSMVLPGYGSVSGLAAGLAVSLYLKRQIGPRMHQIAAQLVNLDEDDLFYLKHKESIDEIGKSLMTTKVKYAN